MSVGAGPPQATDPPPGGAASGASVGRCFILFEDGNPAGQPIDVDVELALARRHGDAPAVAAAVREEADRADRFVDEVALRGEELELDLRRQLVLLRIAIDLEALARDVEHEKRLASLRHRLALRKPQSGRELPRRRTQLARRYRS